MNKQHYRREEHHLTTYSRWSNLDMLMNSEMKKRYGSRFLKYREDWDRTLTQNYIPNFPLMIGIEAVDSCNYKCKWCYRNKYRGTRSKLGLSKYKEIIDEGVKHGLPCVVFGGGGEPMMEIDMLQMLEYAQMRGIIDVLFSTNGSMLTYEFVDHMIDIGVARLQISLDAASKETYDLLRGGDLEYVESMIKYCYKRKQELNCGLPIIRLSFL